MIIGYSHYMSRCYETEGSTLRIGFFCLDIWVKQYIYTGKPYGRITVFGIDAKLFDTEWIKNERKGE